MTAAECYHCGARADGPDDWSRFTLRMPPGQRSPRHTSVVTRELGPVDVCAPCLASPWGAALADLSDDPAARTLRDRGRCVIECRQHARRRRTIVRHFRRESISCPVCFRSASVTHADQPAPPSLGDRLAARYAARTGRELPRLTVRVAVLLLIGGPLLAPVWGAWAVGVPAVVIVLLALAHYALSMQHDGTAPAPGPDSPADEADGGTGQPAATPAGPAGPADAAQLAAQLADVQRELADARASETAAWGRLAVFSESERARNGPEDQADEHETTVDRWAS